MTRHHELAPASQDQATYWNEQAGQTWAAMDRDLDAQLEPFGLVAARALAPTTGERVLDVGCGAGATSRMLAERVAPGEVVGVDVSAPLLDRARASGAGIGNLRFALGDAETFAFDPGAFDAIYSRFGVMFFADPVAAFSNLRTALRPDGRLAFVCWRALHENPSFTQPLEVALPYLSAPPKPLDPTAPGAFALADADRIRDVLARAGWRDVVVAADDTPIVVAGQNDLDRALEVTMRVGPLSRALAVESERARTEIRAAVRELFVEHQRPRGVTFDAATWIVTARR